MTAGDAGGRGADSRANRPIVPPIFQTVTFEAASVADLPGLIDSDTFYTRHGNPTIAHAEQLVADLEGAPCAVAFGSGMAAIATTLLSLLRTGDHLVAQRELYGSTFDLVVHWLTPLGIEVTLVDAASPEQFADAIQSHTKVVYFESPTNPTLRIVDLRRVTAAARERGVVSVIDNTFASPINQRPHELGVDVVVQAATKYLAGHSDILAGMVTASEALARRFRHARVCLGGVLDPHAAWLLIRGLRTLGMRVARQNESALHIAELLSEDGRVERVHYPFHSSHPQHALARSQMSGGGGVLSFELRGGAEETRAFVERLRRFALAPSLGGVESLVTLPAFSSHAAMSVAERERAGVSDQLVRLAVGIEPVEDLVADLRQALDAATAQARRVSVGR